MVRLVVLGLVRLKEGQELLRAGGAGALLGCGLGSSGDSGLSCVPCGELACEVGREGRRLGCGGKGVVLHDANVGILELEDGASKRSSRQHPRGEEENGRWIGDKAGLWTRV